MGDRYQPRYRGHPRNDEYRDTRYAGRYDTYDRHGGHDHYSDDRFRWRDGSYDREPRRDHYDREPHLRNDTEFNFRGAAERHPSQGTRPQRTFDFRAPGPQAPKFPPADQLAPPKRENGAAKREGPGRAGRGGSGTHARNRASCGAGGPGRRTFAPKAAHSRNILRNYGREPTPEQLEGMNADGRERFKDVESNSEAEMADVTNAHHDYEPAPPKRLKVDAPAENAAPKWSNPDPYTALPPPETLGAPKKDIVQVIRKAKIDAAAKVDSSSAVKDNADFISLNFNDDFVNGDASDEISGALTSKQAPPNAPKGPSGYSHRESLYHVSSVPKAQAPSAHIALPALPEPPAVNSAPPVKANGGLPLAPQGFVLPTDEELAEQIANTDGKRKRSEDADVDSDIVDEWVSVGPDSAPWCKLDHSFTAHTGFRLQKEIIDFYEFVKPYEYEEAVRHQLIERVQAALRSCAAPGARSTNIKCFGSFAAGLYLPTADMDLVAISDKFAASGRPSFAQIRPHMQKVAAGMEQAGLARPRSVNVVSRAKVPIIKFKDKLTGIHVDISFENNTGTDAITTFETWKVQYPAMPVIVVIIKQLLAMRGLNEVFSGGLGGFSIICLVVSMMQLMPRLQHGKIEPQSRYGDLLLTFLDLYGSRLDHERVGIRLNPPGYFDKRIEKRIGNPQRLTIIDPNRADNDISGGTHRIAEVFDVFKKAHSRIQQRLAKIREGKDVEGSILACVLGGNYGSFMRQRDNLSRIQRHRPVTPPSPPTSMHHPKHRAMSTAETQQKPKSRRR